MNGSSRIRKAKPNIDKSTMLKVQSATVSTRKFGIVDTEQAVVPEAGKPLGETGESTPLSGVVIAVRTFHIGVPL